MASDIEVWRDKSFAACTPEEMAALRRIMHQIRLTPPRRCTRRTAPAREGRRPDLASHRARDDAHARRAGRAVLAAPPPAGATAGPDPRRLGLDVGLLAGAAPVRLLDTSGGVARRGVLLRHSPDPHHEGARAPPARRGDGAGGQGGVRLGGRHPHRRRARHVRPSLGAPGDEPGSDRRDLLGRPRPRRPRGPGQGDGAVGAPQPPHRLAQPAQGRRPGLPAEHARDDGRRARIDLLLSGHDLRSLEELAALLPSLG